MIEKRKGAKIYPKSSGNHHETERGVAPVPDGRPIFGSVGGPLAAPVADSNGSALRRTRSRHGCLFAGDAGLSAAAAFAESADL